MKIKMRKVAAETTKYSGKASTLAHQLMIAGVAIVWVISGVNTNTSFENLHDLLWNALILFVLALLVSIIQYALVAILLDNYYHAHEKLLRQKGFESEIEIHKNEVEELKSYEKITWSCFYLKHILLLLGYAIVLVYMIQRF